MRGDVVLFKGGVSPVDQVIQIVTKGPYVHAEIDMGDGTFIGAVYRGVERHPQQVSPDIVHIPVHGASDDIEAGLTWVESQVGGSYGWTDIFSQGLRFFGSHFTLSLNGTYDCSDLATRYLTICRAAGPLGALALHPETVSPNDIARAYGLPML